MSAHRARVLIAVIAAVVVLGGIVSLFFYASSFKTATPMTPYAHRYAATVQSINAGTGVYQERNYHVSTATELTTPANGEMLINPIQLTDGEEEAPAVQRGAYTISNTLASSVYTRLTNSKRTEERSGSLPQAAVLSLEYKNVLPEGAWRSLTLYNTENKEELVDSALVFAPSTIEQVTSWGNRTSLYLLDGALTTHAAALLPGINLLNDFDEEGHATGVIYTNRPLALGSLPDTSQDKPALVALEGEASAKTMPYIDTLRMDVSQGITGTDLLFVAPEGKGVSSSIKAPFSRSGRNNAFTMEGGVIAIGEGARLVVGSGRIGTAHPTMTEDSFTADIAQGTIELSPRAIIVDGGTLVLSDTNSGALTINADIQVRNGGTLQIGSNVVINGNIYVYGGGTLEVMGNFRLNGLPVSFMREGEGATQLRALDNPSDESAQLPGGIFIFSKNSLSTEGVLVGAGTFKASLYWVIDGDNGMSPTLMSRVVHFLSAEGALEYPLMYSDYHCQEAQETTHLCEHFGKIKDGLVPEIKIAFSDDKACLELLISSG